MSQGPSTCSGIQLTVARYSLFWLLAANVVGVWLSWLLVYPQANDWLAPLSYGRWMPLHMDWHLYGWSSLPLLGMLMVQYWDVSERGVAKVGLVYALWSSALIVGAMGWLSGEVTGKPFLNWFGWGRGYFVVVLFVLWGICAWGWLSRWRKRSEGEMSISKLWVLGGVTACLFLVPVALYMTTDSTVYPPVDPDSGGATGHSLLASTLGIVMVMGAIPGWGLRLPVGDVVGRRKVVFVLALCVCWILYFLIGHGNASNRDWDQIIGLGSLLFWPFIVAWFWGAFEWSEASRLWRYSFFFWWGLLALNGWVIFLPGVLDVLKFTNGLVAHSHLAMAGMVSAMNMVLLIELGGAGRMRALLSRRHLVVVWNVSVFLYVVLMFWQGVREGKNPGVLFCENQLTEVLYFGRLLVGVAMMVCSGIWWWNSLKEEDRV